MIEFICGLLSGVIIGAIIAPCVTYLLLKWNGHIDV